MIEQMTDDQLAQHIKDLDTKARTAQSQLAHARRAAKKRRSKKQQQQKGVS